MQVSNPDKLLYPAVGLTKADLFAHVQRVAPLMLPHVVGRPLTLVRCPNGESKKCFFQKHLAHSGQPGLRAVGVREREGKADYVVVEDERGLFSLVQLGVLEVHTSGALASDFEHPDLLVFDLDPDTSVPFSAVAQCARRLREIFSRAGLDSYVKTTGGKGLHVCLPVEPTLDWEQAKAFTGNLVRAMVRASPDLYVASSSKAQRTGKIFIDYLRNGRGATFIAPYSTRAHPRATVATPLRWEELTDDLGADGFTVLNFPQRLTVVSDEPFAGMKHTRRDLKVLQQPVVASA